MSESHLHLRVALLVLQLVCSLECKVECKVGWVCSDSGPPGFPESYQGDSHAAKYLDMPQAPKSSPCRLSTEPHLDARALSCSSNPSDSESCSGQKGTQDVARPEPVMFQVHARRLSPGPPICLARPVFLCLIFFLLYAIHASS